MLVVRFVGGFVSGLWGVAAEQDAPEPGASYTSRIRECGEFHRTHACLPAQVARTPGASSQSHVFVILTAGEGHKWGTWLLCVVFVVGAPLRVRAFLPETPRWSAKRRSSFFLSLSLPQTDRHSPPNPVFGGEVFCTESPITLRSMECYFVLTTFETLN